MSRQRNWQLAQKAAGNCTRCGATAQGRTLCDTCAKKKGVMRRKPLKSAWANVDWSNREPNAVIAARLGVTEEAVSYHRRAARQNESQKAKRAVSCAVTVTPADYKSERLKRDLSQAALAALVGVSRGCINYREAGHPRYPITREAWLAIQSLPPKP